MSETDCPYCGSKVHAGQAMDYDSKIKLRCSNCGGFFEFVPGFGAFTLPEQERKGSVRQEGFRPHYEAYEDDAPLGYQRAPPPQSNCGNCCGVAICLCCVLPILMFIFSFILGFGWLFFWLW